MNKLLSIGIWVIIAFVGAWCFGVLALHTGESISAVWIVVAAVCIYAIAYRYYSKYIAYKVLGLDDNRATPAITQNDGRDFVPTNKIVLFGHHFAAIAGAGPLVGPILAAQMGYLPSMIWIVVGVVLAGAVHDFTVLFISMRRNGKSIGEIIKLELGKGVGSIAMIGILGIMMLIIAILALVVVNALAESPWGLFTIAMTIPIAIYMGIHMRFLRPGKIGEASIIGFALLLLALYFGRDVAQSETWGAFFTLDAVTLTYIMIGYGFIAAILPVWFLLAPRDYLSTFLKIGVIVLMAGGILIVAPEVRFSSVTTFIDGSGPVFSGQLFPFLFITIACGAISGFHALISSGTTPKMLERESHARMVGYGSMLMESAVAVMALIAAVILTPGLYFAVNVAPATLGTAGIGDVSEAAAIAAQTISSWGFQISPQDLLTTANEIGEKSILSKTGGAPTFALGLAHIISQMPLFNAGSMAFWYHFAILFEALFILTAVDAGTRAGRFMMQDVLGNVYKPIGDIHSIFWGIVATILCVAGWGYILYQGVTDPQGGVKSLWTLFGVSNQMLAGIALLCVIVVLFKMGKAKLAWVAILPTIWVLVSTLYAAVCKLLPANGEKIHDAVSHVALWQNNSAKASAKLAEAATSTDSAVISTLTQEAAKLSTIATNNLINAVLCAIFMCITILVLIQTIRICVKCVRGTNTLPLSESPYIKLSEVESKGALKGKINAAH
ncbi:carbon starvation protein A [Helicobacter sp. MIT 00-7814]|uniref:carbon starvation CstA family protein n=1 Tax=unclassified Helicobacter TaxID=2593540 RepID=UPI000E1E93E1|nr:MULTISPECIES: carbon starvation CstA family protein [unclassified Helicobacter]RDU53580.1 carbon starvation protein A [Helicobacter sp. MIT 00-7814]RDU56994.1 carbon starvation protein A [Helicobacter sp. MIT 99-10781]